MYKKLTLVAVGAALLCSCAAGPQTPESRRSSAKRALINSTANFGTHRYRCSNNTSVTMTYLDQKKSVARMTVRTVGVDKQANMLNFIVDYFPEPLNIIYQNPEEGVRFIDQKNKDISVTFPLAKKSMMVICQKH